LSYTESKAVGTSADRIDPGPRPTTARTKCQPHRLPDCRTREVSAQSFAQKPHAFGSRLGVSGAIGSVVRRSDARPPIETREDRCSSYRANSPHRSHDDTGW
jgi:hypothetical protein